MTLAAEAALDAAPPETFRALRAHLRSMRYAEAHEAALVAGKGLPLELRAPVRRAHLRRLCTATADALRLLTFDDALAVDEAKRALGGVLYGALREADVLADDAEGRVTSRLLLTPSDGLLVLSDRLREAGAAVMGPGATTTALFRAAEPVAERAIALDLGCGAGTAALHLARSARRVLATDINPRAALLTRINAAMHEIDNVEPRVGDMFAPVEGERLDVVVSQPPFIARPEGAAEATYLYGGARGDELLLRLLAELPRHLPAGARALVLSQWPRLDERPVTALVREALGDDALSVLSLEAPEMPIADYCAQYASVEHAALDDAYARDAQRFRAHMARVGARAITQSLLVIERATTAITAAVPLSSPKITKLRGARITARLATERLLAEDPGALLRARLRLVRGLRITQEVAAPRFTLVHEEDPLVAPIELNGPSFDLLRATDAEPDVRTAIAATAARHRVPRERAVPMLLPLVQEAMRKGVLAPA